MLAFPSDVEYYAGIGSRRAPPDALSIVGDTAKLLLQADMWLRSGGADGCDTAFEDNSGDKKEIFLASDAQVWAINEAKKYSNAYWPHVRPFVKQLLGRNVMIILGRDGLHPVKFVVCWTFGGGDVGGTGHGIRCAKAHGIPVYNLFNDRARFYREVIVERLGV